MKYADDVLFFIGSHSLETDEAPLETIRFRGFSALPRVYERLVACIAVGPISASDDTVGVADMFVPGPLPLPDGAKFEAITKHVRKHRVIRWEDELPQLLDKRVVTPDMVKASLERHRSKSVQAFLAR